VKARRVGQPRKRKGPASVSTEDRDPGLALYPVTRNPARSPVVQRKVNGRPRA